MRNRIKGYQREDKTKIVIPSFSNESKLCGTCAFWTGSRKIKPSGQIELHPYSKGVCDGGGFSHAEMNAMATCDHWELWSLIELHEDSPTKAVKTL
jgi:hypothetical protein